MSIRSAEPPLASIDSLQLPSHVADSVVRPALSAHRRQGVPLLPRCVASPDTRGHTPFSNAAPTDTAQPLHRRTYQPCVCEPTGRGQHGATYTPSATTMSTWWNPPHVTKPPNEPNRATPAADEGPFCETLRRPVRDSVDAPPLAHSPVASRRQTPPGSTGMLRDTCGFQRGPCAQRRQA